MAYTFGGATTDDATVAASVAAGGNSGTLLVAGWWRPTTLTAGRTYWSAGNVLRCEVDATTSELRLVTDNTTDGQWTTSGAGVVVNKWCFLAFFGSFNNTGPAAAWRVWVGDEHTLSAAITPTQAVAPAGNFTSSGNIYAGNAGTGSVAFQGQIGWMFAGSAANVSVIGPWGVAASGVIDAADELRAYKTWVQPLWKGRLNRAALRNGSPNQDFSAIVMDFSDAGFSTVGRNPITTHLGGTISGAVYSAEEPPIRLARDAVHKTPVAVLAA